MAIPLFFTIFLRLNTHFFGLFTLVSQYFIILYFLFEIDKKERKHFFISSLIAGLTTLLLWLPSIKIFFIITKIKSFWIQLPTPEVYFGLFKEFFGNAENIIFIVFILTIYYFKRFLNIIVVSATSIVCMLQVSLAIIFQSIFCAIVLSFFFFVGLIVPHQLI